MSKYPLLTKVLAIGAKIVAGLAIAGTVAIVVAGVFIVRSCYAPLFNHTVEVYVRNKSAAPLTVSFALPRHDVVLDTVWWRGGQPQGPYVIGAYIVRGIKLEIWRMDCSEMFASHPQTRLIMGSIDTVFRGSRRRRYLDTAWVTPKDKSLAIGPRMPNPHFLVLTKKLAEVAEPPRGTYPPIALKPFTADSVLITLQVEVNDSLLVGSKSEGFEAGDPAERWMSDFALSSAVVKWQTLSGDTIRKRLPTKTLLKKALNRAPDASSTKFYHITHYIDYK